jgi:hypothetical protein
MEEAQEECKVVEEKSHSPSVDIVGEEAAITGQTQTALEILQLVTPDHEYHPIHWPTWKKWVINSIYCLLEIFVTIGQTEYVSIEYLIQEKFGGSPQVITLGQSLFIVGNAGMSASRYSLQVHNCVDLLVVGPAFLGPLRYMTKPETSGNDENIMLIITTKVTLVAANGSTLVLSLRILSSIS